MGLHWERRILLVGSLVLLCHKIKYWKKIKPFFSNLSSLLFCWFKDAFRLFYYFQFLVLFIVAFDEALSYYRQCIIHYILKKLYILLQGKTSHHRGITNIPYFSVHAESRMTCTVVTGSNRTLYNQQTKSKMGYLNLLWEYVSYVSNEENVAVVVNEKPGVILNGFSG